MTDIEKKAKSYLPEGTMFAFPTGIAMRAVDPALMDMVKADRAIDPTVFEGLAPFFLTAEMSNQQLDSYYTRMDVSSLRNFAEDAGRGIALQDSHNTNRLGLGRSLRGTVEDANGGKRAVADFYVLPGVKFNGGSYASSDDFILQVRAGIAKDTSVGFYFENLDPKVFAGIRCDLCGEDLYTWDCPHIPGYTYDQTADDGTITRTIATGTVLNAHCSELSAVYDGATPGAAIIKAQYEAGAGRLKPEVARFLEQRYRSVGLRFPDVKEIFALGSVDRSREMADKEKEKETETPPANRAGADDKEEKNVRNPADVQFQADIRKILSEAGFAPEQEIPVALRSMKDEIVTLRASNKEIPALRQQAEDGKLYRKSLIDEALAEGTRANGADFDADHYRKVLESPSMEIESIKRMKADWARMADKLFPGGRQSSDEATTEPVTGARKTPAAAHVS